MKKFLLAFFLGLFILSGIKSEASDGVIRIVVLGSSTAAGAGPTNSANAWVNQYRQYVLGVNASSEVINLAVGGYTTFHLMPSGFSAPANRPTPDPEHNITKALSYSPDAIIINLPSNDIKNGYPLSEQLDNYTTILGKAEAQGVPVWVATTQPCNFTLEKRQNLMDMRDSTYERYGDKAIDFWTDIATAEGNIVSTYDSGDGVHLNDAAHTVLKDRVIATDILSYARANNDVDTVSIDFGSNLSGDGWNNLDNAVHDTILNLKNVQNQNTGLAVWIHDVFTGINTTGATSPDASINFPASATSDSFFGSTGDHSGITEPTGGITLSNLDRHSLYSFKIFACRDGVSDNRETSYIFTGKTEQTVSLNAANNYSNTVSLADVEPASNGTIILTVAPGPNNSNSKEYYYLGALSMISEKQEVVYDTDGVIKIDLGKTPSTGEWNNLSTATGGETISDLVNAEGNSTGFSASLHDSFTGINESGTTSPDASLDIPSSASSDSFFGSEEAHSGIVNPTGGLTISNLNTDLIYSFSFFASRTGVSDNRETEYKVTGKTTETVYLDAANNTSNMVTIENMVPADDGTIKIDVKPGPNNTNSVKYYYLGVVRIEYGPVTANKGGLEINGNELKTSLYPNPFSSNVTIECNLPERGDIQVSIFSIDGRQQMELNKQNVAEGTFMVTWDGADNEGVKSTSGFYLCRINLTTKSNNYSSINKLMLK